MSRTILRTVLKNLALLALVAMPLFFVLVWVQVLLGRAAGATDLGSVMETGGVYYLTNLAPVLLAGLIHQVMWLVLPKDWPNAIRRVVALLLASVIPIAVVVSWGGPARSLLNFAVPMIVALAVYVFLMRGSPSEPAVA